jgi:hypothetical protein
VSPCPFSPAANIEKRHAGRTGSQGRGRGTVPQIIDASDSRVRLIAAERNLPASEIKWIGRLKTYDGVSFAKRHGVSLEWLFCGDLKGLLRTVQWRHLSKTSLVSFAEQA